MFIASRTVSSSLAIRTVGLTFDVRILRFQGIGCELASLLSGFDMRASVTTFLDLLRNGVAQPCDTLGRQLNEDSLRAFGPVPLTQHPKLALRDIGHQRGGDLYDLGEQEQRTGESVEFPPPFTQPLSLLASAFGDQHPNRQLLFYGKLVNNGYLAEYTAVVGVVRLGIVVCADQTR
jgi:hypothetical protein